jgi:hypothetical protein
MSEYLTLSFSPHHQCQIGFHRTMQRLILGIHWKKV